MPKAIFAAAFTGLVIISLTACASIRELSPDTAASRITDSDGYKDEACQIMQRYVSYAMQMQWDQAASIESISPADTEHYAKVFNEGPVVTCRMTIAGRMIDLEANEFAEFLQILPQMQIAYQKLPEGGSVQDCPSCEIAPFRSSNSFLEAYFSRPPFPTVRQERDAARRFACLDRPDEVDSSRSVKQGYTYPLSKGPVPCPEVWRAELSGDTMLRCSRYGSSSYLICPNGVWNDTNHPPKPISHVPQGFNKIHTFSGGFVLALLDGRYDAYWVDQQRNLRHEVLEGTFHLVDIDQDHRPDAVVDDVLLHGNGNGTATRKSLSAYRDSANNRQRQKWSKLQGLGMESWPLDYVEKMLLGAYIGNRELINRAADLSIEWLRQASQRSVQELIQAYWHAELWSRVSKKYDVPDYYAQYGRGNVPRKFDSRKAAIQASAKSSTLHKSCEDLRRDMRQVVERLDQVRKGTELAAKNINAAWERYGSTSIPYAETVQRHRDAQKIAEATEAFLAENCL